MTRLRILISGAGVAGPALAFWLIRAGHDVTLVERFPGLRAGGAQIDLRAQGVEIIKRMGLLEAVRAICTKEPGTSMVDADGKVWATFLANTSGHGSQGMSSEFEIMRGDLVKLLYDRTHDKAHYVFGKSVEHFDQDDTGVTVRFSDGQTDKFDLLVGADGQGSRTRRAILPPTNPDPLRHMGIFMAYWMVPRIKGDSNMCKSYMTGNSQWVMVRSHNETETQVYMITFKDSGELRSIPHASVEAQKAFWEQEFRGSGWQTDRFLDGLKTTDNFYCQEIVQVKIDSWSSGRVVLIADAAHCPSPMTAMGTTSGFVGAYVLAGEINKHSDDVPLALANYEKTMRPFVDEIQKLHLGLIKWVVPANRVHRYITYCLAWMFSFFRIYDLLLRITPDEKGGWTVPDYGDLRREQKP